jgi:phage terminase large subunit-like protein
VANSLEEADTLYKYTTDMIRQNPDLDKDQGGCLWIRDNIKKIEYEAKRSIYKCLSGDKVGKEGRPISCCCYDEISFSDNREVFESLKANCQKRRSGLFVNISSAGFRMAEAIGYEEFLRARRILAGEIIDISTLPVVYAAEPHEDWKSIETAKRCNPSWGVSVWPDKVQEDLNAAIQEPRKEQSYRTRRLNTFVGVSTGWISPQKWAEVESTIDETELRGLDAWLGYDIGFVDNLSVYVICVEKDDKVYLMPRYFCPRDSAERLSRRHKVPYLRWAEHGHITLTDGNAIDESVVKEAMYQDSLNFVYKEVAYDPTRGMDGFRQACEREYSWTMIPTPQKPSHLGNACGWFERNVLGKKCFHMASPVLNWNLENVAIKETAQGLYPYKGAGEGMLIDGIMASLMAISRYIVRETDSGPQFWTF